MSNLSKLNRSFVSHKSSLPTSTIEVEATSKQLLQGAAASVYSAYKFITWRITEQDITTILSKWSLELVHLSLNVTPITLMLSFLKLLTDWIDVGEVFKKCVEMFNYILEFINNKFSQQPSTETVEATSLDIASLSNIKQSAPALAASLASISVIFATIILGRDVSDTHKYKSITEKVADTMMCVTKIKSGMSAVNEIIKDFSTYIYNCMFDIIGLDGEDKLVALIRSVQIPDTNVFFKRDVFEYSKFLTDPINITIIQGNKHYRDQLEFTFNVLTSVRYQFANQPISIDRHTINYIDNIYNELKRVRQSVSKTMNSDSARFCPWWLNLVGGSHTGKSTFTSILVKYMVKTLRHISVTQNIDLELPSAEEELFYSVNFSDKFETNYRGQYFTIIDDFAQDNSVPDINSGLKLITWCSNIPYATNQASLSDKGIPFTSKIIVSTSNDESLNNRKEIICREALTNRICKSYKFVHDCNSKPHPWFPRPISIYEYSFAKYAYLDSPKKNQLITPEMVVADCCKSYLAWFKKEKKLETLREVDNNVLEAIIYNINNTRVEPTSRENILDCSIFDCDEEIGEEIQKNFLFEQYCVSRSYDFDLLEFYDAFGYSAFLQFYDELYNCLDYVALDVFFEQHVLRIFEGVAYNKVEPTSRSIYCYMNLTPRITNGKFDCDCEDHSERNRLYENWMSVIKPEFKYTVLEFEDSFSDLSIKNENLSIRLKTTWDSITNYLKKIVKNPIFAIIGGAVLAYVAFSSRGKELEDEVVETNKSYSNTPRKRVPRNFRINNVQPTSYEVEATYGFAKISDMFSNTISANAMEIVSNSIIKNGNICLLKSPYKANTGVRVEGNAILTNNHFLTSLKNGDKLIIEYCIKDASPQKYEQTFNSARCVRIPNTDLAIYKCDYSLPNCKSIVKHFPTDIVRGNHKQSLVVTADPIPTVFTNIIATPNIHKSRYLVDNIEYDTLDSFSTNCPVQKGMSGSILFSLDRMDQHKIIGLQTCRNTNGLNSYGYFKPVTQSEIRDALKKLEVEPFYTNVEQIVEETCAINNKTCPPNLLGGNLTYLGNIPKDKQIKSQTNTKIEKSLIYEFDNETQQPAVLHDYDERLNDDLYGKSVIFRAIQGFVQPIGKLDTETLENAKQQLSCERDVLLDVVGIPRRVLSLFECINGVPDVILPINMKTSPGYPYVLKRKITTMGGKYEWFNQIHGNIPEGYGKIYEPKEDLLSGLEQAEQQLKQGIMPNFLAYCCLKDETRPIEKIKAGKTRAFICLPLHYGILVRKYCGAYISAMKKKAGIISSCVGIDPSKQWSALYDKLMSKNNMWEDFDYANWDQHLHGELIMQIADVMNKWYNDGYENARIRRILFYFLIHTPIIVKDRLFLKSQGQCSGCPITAELNCEVHDLLMLYIWIKFHQDRNIESDLSEMRENLALCIYGDDIVTSLNSDYDIEFTGTNIKPYMLELGMHITPGDKKSINFELKHPEHIFFLKRNFVRDGENILAPLRKDIIENIFQWVHKSDDKVSATTENCKTALREAYMHRKTYFNELAIRINSQIKKLNTLNNCILMKPIIMDYDVIDKSYVCGSYVCAGLEPVTLTETA